MHITTEEINNYICERQEQGAANATINRELSTLKLMFKLAIRAKKFAVKPYIPLLAEGNARAGFFEHAEFLSLRNLVPDHLKPVLTFAYFTGWRKSEILTLRWSHVDLESRTVRLDPGATKTGQGRLIRLNGELLQAMREQWTKRKIAEIPNESPALLCPYVFHRNGKPIRDSESHGYEHVAQQA